MGTATQLCGQAQSELAVHGAYSCPVPPQPAPPEELLLDELEEELDDRPLDDELEDELEELLLLAVELVPPLEEELPTALV